MSMEGAIVTKLRGTAGVTALVNQRVWPMRRPQARELPAVTVTRVDGGPIYTDDGESGLATARMQIDCWGATYTDAKDTAAAIKTALSGYVGTTGGTAFRFIYLDAERDMSESGSNTSEYLFRVVLDFMVMFDN